MDKGVVIKVEGKFAYVNMKQNASCKSCAGRGICFAGDKPLPLKIDNNQDFKVGDQVELELKSRVKLTSAFLLFILPLIMMVIGYALAIQVRNSEGTGISGSLVGLFFSVIFLKIINKKIAGDKDFKPAATKVIQHESN